MKLIKSLSDRQVSLYVNKEKKKIVERNVTQQQLWNILDFYKNSNFSHRPKLLYHDATWTIRNEWINGNILEILSDFNIKKIAQNIIDLSDKSEWTINLSDYIKNNFQNKMETIFLSKEQQKCVNIWFNEIFWVLKEQKIWLNWTHWDLKWENIILNKDEQYIIDWEWVKKGNYMEDVQSILQKDLWYDARLCDKFINQINKVKNINQNLFLFLDNFHYFLNMILQLSKGRIEINWFKEKLYLKMNAMSKWVIFGNKIYPTQHWHENKDIDKNKERLIKNKESTKNKNNWLVFHAVAFETIAWHNVLLWWKAGAWKSFIFHKLKELWIVKNLYDQDLVKFKDWNIYSLTDQSFKWFENGIYIYENNINNNYWKLDYVFFINNNFYWIKKTNFDNNNIIKYMLHKEYNNIWHVYKDYKLWKNLWIKSYIIGNDKENDDFIFLQDILSKKK